MLTLPVGPALLNSSRGRTNQILMDVPNRLMQSWEKLPMFSHSSFEHGGSDVHQARETTPPGKVVDQHTVKLRDGSLG